MVQYDTFVKPIYRQQKSLTVRRKKRAHDERDEKKNKRTNTRILPTSTSRSVQCSQQRTQIDKHCCCIQRTHRTTRATRTNEKKANCSIMATDFFSHSIQTVSEKFHQLREESGYILRNRGSNMDLVLIHISACTHKAHRNAITVRCTMYVYAIPLGGTHDKHDIRQCLVFTKLVAS